MLPHQYTDTKQTHTNALTDIHQTYTPSTVTHTDTQTHTNTKAGTYKHTSRYIQTHRDIHCIGRWTHKQTHRATYKYTHKHRNTQIQKPPMDS